MAFPVTQSLCTPAGDEGSICLWPMAQQGNLSRVQRDQSSVWSVMFSMDLCHQNKNLNQNPLRYSTRGDLIQSSEIHPCISRDDPEQCVDLGTMRRRLKKWFKSGLKAQARAVSYATKTSGHGQGMNGIFWYLRLYSPF